ncbi:signal peptide peptidase 2-like isoform X2 [Diospyros lotus]|uniref:signal peptide peptidase 2-like isoform X2 n=1 Tax=Diospyros lotus TaxID=55363 RepID=UPI0022594DD6|nr:signal peptide peptidase 2-like isoform X2 [Diospyros lotus]
MRNSERFANIALAGLTLAPLFIKVDPNLNVILTACLMVYVGCYRSVKPTPPSETMSNEHAMRFPLVGSAMLLSLFLLFKFLSKDLVNAVLTCYFFVLGIVALSKHCYLQSEVSCQSIGMKNPLFGVSPISVVFFRAHKITLAIQSGILFASTNSTVSSLIMEPLKGRPKPCQIRRTRRYVTICPVGRAINRGKVSKGKEVAEEGSSRVDR